MTYIDKLRLIGEEEFKDLVFQFRTKYDLHMHLNIPYNGAGSKALNDRIKETGAILQPKDYKYERITKICPICEKEFSTLKGHRDEKSVCSHACSNTKFRSGTNNGNWKPGTYRTTCFLHHEKKCVCCDERLIVAVHHLDGDRSNNEPENLIPLCPTHHVYWHSSHRQLIEDIVHDYINKFKLGIAEMV